MRLADCTCGEFSIHVEEERIQTQSILKPNKMELHPNIHVVIVLRNILKILWLKKTIMQIL